MKIVVTSLQKTTRQAAFTLVELLVVIVIIIGLASIVIPMAMNAKGSTDVAECVTNLKELHTARLAYSNDNYGRLPANGMDDNEETLLDESKGWFVALAPYVYDSSDSKKVLLEGKFRCPADLNQRQYNKKQNVEASAQTVSYVCWTDGSDNPEDPQSPINISRGYNQDTVAWLSDGNPVISGKNIANELDFTQAVLPAAERHGGKINVLYATGAIKTVEDPTFYKVSPGIAQKEHLK